MMRKKKQKLNETSNLKIDDCWWESRWLECARGGEQASKPALKDIER